MTLPMFPSVPMPEPKLPNLRPYQERGIRLLRMHAANEINRILAVGPTGMGKMVMIAAITKLATCETLFVAHRMELIDQCADQLARFGVTNVGVIRGADERYNPAAATQIASIQTLARRDKPKAGLIFIDEAHRAGSDSYIQHVFQAYPEATIIGWSASPTRLDGKPLGGNLFQVLEVIVTHQELLKHPDWLVAPDCFSTPTRIDLSSVRTIGGDYDEEQLGEVMRSSHLEGEVVEHWLKRSEGRRTIVFAVNIAHSKSLAERFSKHTKAAHIDGKTPEDERRAILRDSSVRVVVNCNVLLEGVDVPEFKCCVHARPTQSIVLWRQSVGRIMRPWGNLKPILLDHAGNWDRLWCPFEDLQWSLSNRAVRMRGRVPMKLCKQCFAYVEGGRIICPHCKYEFKPGDNAPAQLPEETKAELELRRAEPEELRKAFFVRQVVLAKTKGFKPGFASAIYKDHYGTWPPRAWSDEVKADFATDAAWQAALERRAKRKAIEQAQEKAEMSALEKQMAGTLDAMNAPEPDFADWWESKQ